MLSLDKDFLKGSIPPLVTPFKNGAVDYRKAAIEAGADLEAYRGSGRMDTRVTVSSKC